MLKKLLLLSFFALLILDHRAYPQNIDFLKVSGSKIVNVRTGAPVKLKGVALSNGVYNNKGGASEKMPDWALNEKDVIFLKDLGATGVRYCINYKWIMNENGFRVIDRDLALFEKHGLYVILNLHVPPGSGTSWGQTVSEDLFYDPNWVLFMDLWKKLATRYKRRAIIAAYEPFNEPKPENIASFKKKTDEFVSLVRSIEKDEPHQHIIVATNPIGLRKNGITTFINLPIPKINDNNILYNFHFYSPGFFTTHND